MSSSIIIRDKIYVPVRLIDADAVAEHYTRRLYDDRACAKCEYRQDRHSYLCDTCEAYLDKVRLFSRKDIGGKHYLGLPIGDKRNFTKVTGLDFEGLRIRDRRVLAPFDYRIKFLATLRDYQEPVVTKFLKKKYGLLEAPPRTGKTLMMLYICLELGQRTVILADQYEFLRQFEYHITGHAKSDTPKCTNLPELQDKYGVKLFGMPKTDEDFKNFQFFLMTYQQFLSEVRGKDRFRKLARNVGTLAIDEVHSAAASEYSKVLSMFPSRYKFGVTATVNRKDGRQFIIKNILGPVVAKSSREALTPVVYVHKTKFVPRSAYNNGRRSWVFAMQALARDKGRNKMIVDQIIRDLKAGHNIVIPVLFKKHVFELQDMINKAWGSKICDVFIGVQGAKGKAERENILDRAKRGRTRVVVGIRRILQRGLNVPAWSCIYEIAPISNKPNFKQESTRICTPMEGKNQPIIRLFYDMELGQSIGCARNTLKHCASFKYKFSDRPEQRNAVKEIMSTGGRRGRQEGEFDPVDEQFKPVRSKGLFGAGAKRL